MFYYLTVRFSKEDGSLADTNYLYQVSREDFDAAKIGRRFTIENEVGYSYRSTPVEVTGKADFDDLISEYSGHAIRKVRLTNKLSKEVYFKKQVDLEISSRLRSLILSNDPLKNTIFYNGDYFSRYHEAADRVEKDILTEELEQTTLNKDPNGLTKGEQDFFQDWSSTKEISTINKNKNKGDNTMKLFGNVQFGKYEGKEIKASFKGIAIRTPEGKYNSYDKVTNEVTDVTDFLIDIDMAYLMPVALKNIVVGDVIKHGAAFVIVRTVKEDGVLEVINVATSEVTNILPIKNIFGFNFYTKVMDFFSGAAIGNTASADSPFGNMMPLLMMSQGEGKIDPMMMMLMMGQGQGQDAMNNPMMMAMMMGGDNKIDPMMMMLMMGNSPFGKAL